MTGLFWPGGPAPALERRSLLRKVHPRSNRDNRSVLSFRSAQPGSAATAPPPPPARGSTPPEHACKLPSPPSTYPLPRVPGTGKLCPSGVPPLRESERARDGQEKGANSSGIKAQDGGGGGGGGGYGSCSNPCPVVAQKKKKKKCRSPSPFPHSPDFILRREGTRQLLLFFSALVAARPTRARFCSPRLARSARKVAKATVSAGKEPGGEGGGGGGEGRDRGDARAPCVNLLQPRASF